MTLMSAIYTLASFDAPTPLWRLSVHQYHEMLRLGILTEKDPVELLEGCLVEKMPHNPRHSILCHHTRQALAKALPQGWFVQLQAPITLMDSQPEPDVCVVRGTPEDYQHRRPSTPDLALVVEVSDTTLARDQEVKLRMYARSLVAVCWILNLPGNQLEIYTDPSGAINKPAYRSRQISSALDPETIQRAVQDLLG